jgi:hypothetical protein
MFLVGEFTAGKSILWHAVSFSYSLNFVKHPSSREKPPVSRRVIKAILTQLRALLQSPSPESSSPKLGVQAAST